MIAIHVQMVMYAIN